jgi:hypothetical protein
MKQTKQTSCHHRVLVPCWENPADLGIESRAIGYRCDACSETFNPVHAYLLRLEAVHCLRRLRAVAEDCTEPPTATHERRAGKPDRYEDRTYVRSLELMAAHMQGLPFKLLDPGRN